ncbi:MAG: hypothetical protein QOE83_1987 [Actinomycetota bacterium]|nr:hypothetical protein [Actinomycetota bacterium]
MDSAHLSRLDPLIDWDQTTPWTQPRHPETILNAEQTREVPRVTQGKKAALAHWATLSPQEQIEALRRGYTPYAHRSGDSAQRDPKTQGKKGEVYRAGRALSSGFETSRRKH